MSIQLFTKLDNIQGQVGESSSCKMHENKI